MFGLLFIALALLAVAGLIAGVILWASSGSGSKEMACNACGYAVKGLTQFTCPECGADLREVGIRQSANPGRRRLGITLILGFGGVLMLGCVLMGALFFWANAPTQANYPHQAMPTQASPTATNRASSTVLVAPPQETPPMMIPNASSDLSHKDERLKDRVQDPADEVTR